MGPFPLLLHKNLLLLHKYNYLPQVSLSMPIRSISYVYLTNQWMVVHAESREVYTADYVGDLGTAEWKNFERCPGSDGSLAIPQDGLGTCLFLFLVI